MDQFDSILLIKYRLFYHSRFRLIDCRLCCPLEGCRQESRGSVGFRIIIIVGMLGRAQSSQNVAGMVRIGSPLKLSNSEGPSNDSGHSLLGFVSQTARPGLATAQDVSDETFTAVETTNNRLGVGCRMSGSIECSLDQRPASSDPMAIAAVDEFVGTTREASFWRILSSREPRDQQW